MSSNKTILITGASRGLGKATAEFVASNLKSDVIFTFNKNEDAAKDTKKSLEALGVKANYLQLDVSDVSGFKEFSEKVEETLKTWGKTGIDGLVHNGGIFGMTPFEQVSADQVDEMLTVHYKGPVFLTQALLPHINDNSSIVYLSTAATRFNFGAAGFYAAAKAAGETWVKYLATELGPRGIRVNSIAPGAIPTDMTAGIMGDEASAKGIADGSALKRLGHRDQIASAVNFLLSDASKWVTGERIEASGGFQL